MVDVEQMYSLQEIAHLRVIKIDNVIENKDN